METKEFVPFIKQGLNDGDGHDRQHPITECAHDAPIIAGLGSNADKDKKGDNNGNKHESAMEFFP